jgi:hypothetical protein
MKLTLSNAWLWRRGGGGGAVKKEVASQRWQKVNPQDCDSCIHRDSNGNPHALTGSTR